MTKTCVQLVSGFECGAIVREGTEGFENSRCPEHFAYHMNKREVVLELDETDGVYRCTSANCKHDFSPYFGRDFAEVRDIRYTVARLENLGFRVKLVENHDEDSLNPHGVTTMGNVRTHVVDAPGDYHVVIVGNHPIYLIGDEFISTARHGFSALDNGGVTCIVQRPLLALPEGEPKEPREHYHVVSFINGCLNDYDSGAIDTLEDARIELAEYIDNSPFDSFEACQWVPAGVDRYVQVEGLYIAKIESCTEECFDANGDALPVW